MAKNSKGTTKGNRTSKGRLSRREILSGLGTGLTFASLGRGTQLDLKVANDNGNKMIFAVPDLSTGYIAYGENISVQNDGDGKIIIKCKKKN